MTVSTLPSYEEALRDPDKARLLFDASKGGNVRGITENHRFVLADVFQRAAEPEVAKLVSTRITVDNDMGYVTEVTALYGPTLLGIRRAVRELNMGSIEICSPYDCTGLLCDQRCKLLKVYRAYAGQYVAIVEIRKSYDV